MPLSRERIEQIVAEVQAKMVTDEDAIMAEKIEGARCMCCDQPIPGPPPGQTRECASCTGYA